MWHAWERTEKCTRFWRESPKERDHWEDQGVCEKMGSEWILGRLAWGGCGLDSAGSGQGPVAGCCECDDEPSGSCATELVSAGCSVVAAEPTEGLAFPALQYF
jgi:hypothetical protein